jgi:hypothetical protein
MRPNTNMSLALNRQFGDMGVEMLVKDDFKFFLSYLLT